jgi:hypothetical protein
VGTDAAALPKSGHGNDAEAEWKGAGARLLTELEVMQVTHCPVITIASNTLVHAQPAMFAVLKATAVYISAVGARCRLDIVSRDMQKGHWYYFIRTRLYAIVLERRLHDRLFNCEGICKKTQHGNILHNLHCLFARQCPLLLFPLSR